MSRYAQKIPYKFFSEEWKSFLNYAREHYIEAVVLSLETVKSALSPEEFRQYGDIAFKVLLDKTASPLVYIWESWQLLTSEDKLPYATPKYRKTLEQIIQKSKEVASQIGEVK